MLNSIRYFDGCLHRFGQKVFIKTLSSVTLKTRFFSINKKYNNFVLQHFKQIVFIRKLFEQSSVQFSDKYFKIVVMDIDMHQVDGIGLIEKLDYKKCSYRKVSIIYMVNPYSVARRHNHVKRVLHEASRKTTPPTQV